MDRIEMTEPVGASVGVGAVISKFGVPVVAAAVASAVVMLMTMPKTKKQQAVALITTFVGSIFGGAFALDYFHLTELSKMAQGAVYLVSGLPFWTVVRGYFAYTERDTSKGIVDYIKEVRSAWGGDK